MISKKFLRLVSGSKRNIRLKIGKRYRTIAIALAVVMFFQAIQPQVLYGLTAGPKSPEFATFTPVAASDMVNLATGDFSYNIPVIEIPGPDGAGYALSLSYNSGVNPEQEASWVGFGWNLNPGAINRDTRGVPDDYNGEEIEKYNKARPNFTVGANAHAYKNLFGIPSGMSLSAGIRYNNYRGYSTNVGFGLSLYGLSANINMDQGGEKTFSADIDIFAALRHYITKSLEGKIASLNMVIRKVGDMPCSDSYVSALGASRDKLRAKQKLVGHLSAGSNYGLFTGQFGEYNPIFSKFGGLSVNTSFLNLEARLSQIPSGWAVGTGANFNFQYNQYFTRYESYGFLHSESTSFNMEDKMMDYYMEKETSLDIRDVFIGMPFSNYDYFNVSGEGMNGGFRAYAKHPGYYKPSTGSSKILMLNMGLKFEAGLNVGITMDVGAGRKKSSLDLWEADDDRMESFGTGYKFRFNNDMGTAIDYTPNDTEIPDVKLKRKGDFPGTRWASSNNVFDNLEEPISSETSNIEYFVKKGSQWAAENPEYTNVPDDAIVGFRITNESGVTYVYQQPVFNYNETSISVDVNRNSDNNTVENEYYAYRDLKLIEEAGKYVITNEALRDIDQNHNTVVGEIKNVPFANLFLLTEIIGSDYIDLSNDGPSEDDFGSWTKFKYHKQPGIYRYRTPYFGLGYSQNSISDPYDDMGSLYSGQKEIYYLEEIETKSHKAVFELSDRIEDRVDGVSAMPLTAEGDPAACVSRADIQGNMHLKKLNLIKLYAKSTPEKLIKTVHFNYNNSLVPDLPNNTNTSRNYLRDDPARPGTAGTNTGKLTLTGLWFSYEGINPAKVNPYQFKYHYKKSTGFKAGSKYFTSETGKNYDALLPHIQNPSYDPFILGPWGSVSPYAKESRQNQKLWVYQGAMPEEAFDPAAWTLKQIILPSGGEIHIQYEQDEYKYVQNRPGMIMVSLLPGYDNDDGKFYINLEDLGINPSSEEGIKEIEALKKMITEYYLTPGKQKKIYYKFLYALKGDTPGLLDESSEYITGYAGLSNVTIDALNRLCLDLYERDKNSAGGYTKIPRTACKEFYRYNRLGIVDRESSITDFPNILEPALKNVANRIQVDYPQLPNPDAEENVSKGFAKEAAKLISSSSLKDGKSLNQSVSASCRYLEPSLSYIKIPTIKAKRGGDSRVKRVLIYDKGIETGSAVMYGNQYRYVLEDGQTSSGVATNEPPPSREENPLVEYLKKKDQLDWDRITTGTDKEQNEGPMGESLLPAAAIVYSRVITENIHTGKTGTGFTVNEYFTTKDYPFDYISLNPDFDYVGKNNDKVPIKSEYDKLKLNAIVVNFNINKLWLAQGFRFIINSMNGVQKRVTSYGGQYQAPDNANGFKFDTDGGYIVSQQEYEYFEPGERIPVWSWNNSAIVAQDIVPGKEMDLAAEKKYSKDNTLDFRVSIDPSVGLSLIPLFFVTVFPSITIDSKEVYTHAATKVIRYPVILKKVNTLTDNRHSETEYMAFDKATGKPIVTRTSDSYSGIPDGEGIKSEFSYYSFEVPAFWIYNYMGKKSQAPAGNSQNYKNILSAIAVKINTYGKKDEAMPGPGSITKPYIPLIFNLEHVLNVSVQTFKNEWNNSWGNAKVRSDYNLGTIENNTLNQGWKPWSSFIYQSNQIDHLLGTFELKESLDLNGSGNSNKWIKATEITKYSPNGNPLEEVNALGIYSSVLYDKGYKNMVPSMVAGNAQYDVIYFNSFEGTGSYTPPQIKAHSGKYCYQYQGLGNLLENVFVTENLKRTGGRIFVWLHDDNLSGLTAGIRNTEEYLVIKEVARVEGWILYHMDLAPEQLTNINPGTKLDIQFTTSRSSCYIDDVRFQPFDAQASCFVYDNALRLITQFDDQHFGTYYQYNDEGQLVRKIIETERGRKTIQETQYNLREE